MFSKIFNKKLYVITKPVNSIVFCQETFFIISFCSGQLYGLEKFWAFLKYSRRRPKVDQKLEEILKNYKCLEDFRVEGASFPQQFYSTKSGIVVRSIDSFSFSFDFSFVFRRFRHPKRLPQLQRKTTRQWRVRGKVQQANIFPVDLDLRRVKEIVAPLQNVVNENQVEILLGEIWVFVFLLSVLRNRSVDIFFFSFSI